ncbi:MAG: DUF192 domain-containing protein [Pseudomonadota bacterium]
MTRRVILLIGLLALFADPRGAWAQGALASFERDELVIERADGGSHRFDIELALEPQQQAQGLMYRRKMAPEAGMLFIYEPVRQVAMWMQNTYIPLDMIFIQADGQIVKIVERTVPLSQETISSDRPVRAVLEVNGGTAARLDLKPGDRVVHALIGGAP